MLTYNILLFHERPKHNPHNAFRPGAYLFLTLHALTTNGFKGTVVVIKLQSYVH